MEMGFYGAAGCVTGSCHILKVNNRTILLDCGMYQGKDEKDRGNTNFSFDPKNVDFVILSHSHIDHSGRIPLLYKQGFRGQIICTEATKDLCGIMLPDSGHIQEMEMDWKNRKRLRQGLDTIEPLYTAAEATLCMSLFNGFPYNIDIELFQGMKIKFNDAGHLLGSAITEIFINENGKDTKLVYTGDLGNVNIPLLKDPTMIKNADYVIMESTYGDRLHKTMSSEFKELVDIINQTFKRGGNVIIPSFAVGRAQEVLYAINKYVESDILKNVTVFVDSPLASEATAIFNKNSKIYDDDALSLIKKGDNPLDFKGLVFTKSPQDSAKVNKIQSGAIVISASGMCEAGRIRHHLKHNLWRKECSIVFVGYQAEGTLGRALLDGIKKVKLFGEDIAVNANIYNFEGLSGHADRQGLLNWLEHFDVKPKKVLLVHGDKDALESFKNLIESKGFNVSIMKLGDTYRFDENNLIENKSQSAHNESIDIITAREKINELLNSYNGNNNINKEELLSKIKKYIS